MGPRTLLVLLLLALGLGAVLYFTDQKPPVKTLAESPVLDGRSLRDAVHMRWQFPQRQAIEVGRAPDGRLQLKEPIIDIASAGRMEQFVVAWNSAQMQAAKLADDDQGRQQAGLTTPELKFEAAWADGTRIAVDIGGPGPLSDKDTRYMRRDGKIWVASSSLYESLRIGQDDLRERQVFRHAFAQASELKVDQVLPSGKRELLHLLRDDKGWQLKSPVEGRADPVAAQRFVTSVLGLRISDFGIGMPRLPERDPELVVNVRGAYGEESVRLWQELGHLYGVLPARDVVIACESQLYQQIFTNAADNLRARILLPMGESTFEELLELVVDPGQGRGERVRLTRESPSTPWRLVEPVEFETAPTPCNEAAFAVNQLVAREFVRGADGQKPSIADPRFGLDPAQRLTVTVRGGQGIGTSTLWFGSASTLVDEAVLHCCRADEPGTIVLVQKAPVDALQRPWTDYCALRVIQQNAAIERLDLSHRDGRAASFVLQDGVWARVGKPGPRPEVGEFANDVLRDLFGKRAVDARGAAFAQPDYTVKLMRRNGDELGEIRVFDRAADAPLVVQAVAGPVAFELGTLPSQGLRALWQ